VVVLAVKMLYVEDVRRRPADAGRHTSEEVREAKREARAVERGA
jgi:hypothetical protein